MVEGSHHDKNASTLWFMMETVYHDLFRFHSYPSLPPYILAVMSIKHFHRAWCCPINQSSLFKPEPPITQTPMFQLQPTWCKPSDFGSLPLLLACKHSHVMILGLSKGPGISYSPANYAQVQQTRSSANPFLGTYEALLDELLLDSHVWVSED